MNEQFIYHCGESKTQRKWFLDEKKRRFGGRYHPLIKFAQNTHILSTQQRAYQLFPGLIPFASLWHPIVPYFWWKNIFYDFCLKIIMVALCDFISFVRHNYCMGSDILFIHCSQKAVVHL